jgi:hypothetical protein
VGSGASVLFWDDCWLQGQCVAMLAPGLLAMVQPRPSVLEQCRKASPIMPGWLTSLGNWRWSASSNSLTSLWVALNETDILALLSDDIFRWKWTASGAFSTKSAYLAFFESSITLPGKRIGCQLRRLSMKFHADLGFTIGAVQLTSCKQIRPYVRYACRQTNRWII